MIVTAVREISLGVAVETGLRAACPFHMVIISLEIETCLSFFCLFFFWHKKTSENCGIKSILKEKRKKKSLTSRHAMDRSALSRLAPLRLQWLRLVPLKLAILKFM